MELPQFPTSHLHSTPTYTCTSHVSTKHLPPKALVGGFLIDFPFLNLVVEIISHVAQGDLEATVNLRLALNCRSSHFCLPSARVTSRGPQVQLSFLVKSHSNQS